MGSPIEEVVSPPYKAALRTITIVGTVVAGFFVAQDRFASFVDERIRIKTEVADKVMAAQTQRLEKLDARMDAMQTGMVDIKVDIAKIRAILEDARGK